MTFENTGVTPLDYYPCQYGESRLQFRGPQRRLDGDYIAFLGGTETYGKFIEKPFPALVEDDLGLKCVNFGQINAGVDVFLNDLTVLTAASRARHSVVQVLGASNLSNRFYSVHPRRNDRFLKVSQTMKSVFREVDFTEFHFTRHMLQSLATKAPDRFSLVMEEVQQAWLSRMNLLLDRLGDRTVLLWLSDHPSENKRATGQIMNDPFGIERWMIDRLKPRVASVVEVVVSATAMSHGTKGMVFSPLEAPAAQALFNPKAHQEAAQAVSTALQSLNGKG